MAEYVYLIRPTRDQFIETMTPEESEIMGNHFQYLQTLLSQQTLVLAGPCLDGAFGVVIYKAESLDAARSIMENDPAVQSGLMQSELHPYRISLLQS